MIRGRWSVALIAACCLVGLVAIPVVITQYDRLAYYDSAAEFTFMKIDGRPSHGPSFAMVQRQRWSWLPGKPVLRRFVTREQFEAAVAGATIGLPIVGIGCGEVSTTTTTYRFDLDDPSEFLRIGDRAHEHVERLLAIADRRGP